MEKELRTKIKTSVDKIPQKDLKKLQKYIERLTKNQEKVNQSKKGPISFSKACDKLVTKIQQNLTPKIDSNMFRNIVNTINQDTNHCTYILLMSI